jgi:hypothetical protein
MSVVVVARIELSSFVSSFVLFIQGVAYNRPLVGLLDSGSDSSHIQRRALPDGVTPDVVHRLVLGLTGEGTVNGEVTLTNMLLPELSRTLRINDTFKCNVMDNKSQYDIILGRDFLTPVVLDLKHSTQEIKWLDQSIPFRTKHELADPFALYSSCLEAFALDDSLDEE